MGVSTNNVEKVIHKVLTQLGGIEVGKLPKSTFAKYMVVEARALAQIKVAEQLLENWHTESRTLHSDQTSKKGRSFATYDIVKDDGEEMVIGKFHLGMLQLSLTV